MPAMVSEEGGPAPDAGGATGPVPPVPWGPPPAPPAQPGTGTYVDEAPPFTVGALLRDTLARYAADPLRLIALAVIPSAFSYLASIAFGPVADPRNAIRMAPLLGLVGLVIAIIAASTTLALLEGGPRLTLRGAYSRGLRRSGWLVLTAIVIALLFLVVGLVASLALGVLALVAFVARGPGALLILYPLLIVVIAWVATRLALAIVAVVVDDLNTGQAIGVAWRATRRWGVSLRILAAGLLLGLLLLPASFGAAFLELPAAFGGQGAFSVLALAILAVLTPFSSAFGYSAYRRLVPPFWPPWVGPPTPVLGADGVETIPPPRFVAPPFDQRARVLLVLLAVLGVVGLVLLALGIGTLVSTFLHLQFVPGQPYYPGGPTFPPAPSFPPLPTFAS